MSKIQGLEVVIRQPAPKMQLSADVPVTDEFRAEINAWMINFFGFGETDIWGRNIHDEVIISQDQGVIFMSQKIFDKLTSAKVGENEGEVCNRDGCSGLMGFNEVEGCNCFISPPCSRCTDNPLLCLKCGLEPEEQF